MVLEDRESALTEVLEEILYQSSDHLLEIEIQKLTFLIEATAVEKYGGRLTCAQFKPLMSGPFSEDIDQTLHELKECRDVISKTKRRREKPEKGYKKLHPSGIAAGKSKFISDSLALFQDSSVDDLIKYSKENYMYRETPGGEKISFVKYHQALKQNEADPLTGYWREDNDATDQPKWIIPLDCGPEAL